MPFDRRTFLAASAAVIAGAEGQPKKPRSPFLEGNYAPVKEEITADDLKVVGKLPWQSR